MNGRREKGREIEVHETEKCRSGNEKREKERQESWCGAVGFCFNLRVK